MVIRWLGLLKKLGNRKEMSSAKEVTYTPQLCQVNYTVQCTGNYRAQVTGQIDSLATIDHSVILYLWYLRKKLFCTL